MKKMMLMIAVLWVLAASAVAEDVNVSANITNVVPYAGSTTMNSGAPVTLTANQTTHVWGTSVIVDDNGCDEISAVNATFFRTNVAGGDGATDDPRNHYSAACVSAGDCESGDDTMETYNCSFDIKWYADPTDVGSIYADHNWTFNVTPHDETSGTSDSDVMEMQTLTSFEIPALTLDFGVLALDANTTNENHSLLVRNTGNEAIDMNLRGYGAAELDTYCMACTVGNVPVGYLEYSNEEFTYGFGADLANADALSNINLDRGTSVTERPQTLMYFGLGFPDSGVGGTCSGTLVFTAVSDPFIT